MTTVLAWHHQQLRAGLHPTTKIAWDRLRGTAALVRGAVVIVIVVAVTRQQRFLLRLSWVALEADHTLTLRVVERHRGAGELKLDGRAERRQRRRGGVGVKVGRHRVAKGAAAEAVFVCVPPAAPAAAAAVEAVHAQPTRPTSISTEAVHTAAVVEAVARPLQPRSWRGGAW